MAYGRRWPPTLAPMIGKTLLLAAVFIALLASFQLKEARAHAQECDVEIGGVWLAVVSVLSAAGGVAIGGALGYAIMFGPSHITGDFIGLPWLTMIPALIGGFWVTTRAGNALIPFLVRHFGDRNAT